jgi:hypothetical protein
VTIRGVNAPTAEASNADESPVGVDVLGLDDVLVDEGEDVVELEEELAAAREAAGLEAAVVDHGADGLGIEAEELGDLRHVEDRSVVRRISGHRSAILAGKGLRWQVGYRSL